MKKAKKILLPVGIMLCLLQVWLPACFLTGDGPCHLYNAQILHDTWCGVNTSFYAAFYNISYAPNPNLLSTVLLALLLFVFKGIIAEKMLLTFYVLLFTGGFYLLLKRISSNAYWPLVVFLFVFPHVLAKGFYNYSFSVAFYFWVVWSWLRFLDRRNLLNAAIFFVFTAMLYFTHLLSFMFGAFTCVALILSYGIATEGYVKAFARNFLLKYAGFLLLFISPFLVLSIWFTERQGGLQLRQLRPHFYRLIELVEFKYLINFRHTEDVFAEIAGIILLFLFSISLFGSGRSFKISKYDGLLLSFFFVLFVYLCFPEAFLGKLILVSMRVQPFVFMLIGCCIAYRFPAHINKKRYWMLTVGFFLFSISYLGYLIYRAGGIVDGTTALGMHIQLSCFALSIVLLIIGCIGFSILLYQNIRETVLLVTTICFIALTIARVSCLFDVAPQASDYLSAAGHIKPNAVILPLDFAPSGIDKDGKEIADRNFLFVHIAQYIGVGKPLISLDNYEAHMGYFPINWVEKKDPYNFFGASMEELPPYGDIISYQFDIEKNIDYILMWCYNPAYIKNEQFARLYAQIQAGYHQVYISPLGKTILYARNQQ